MRHGDKINNLGRTASHRRALLANLANALITHKRINTTLAKAKALRRYAEPLLTKAKDNTTHSRRIIFGYLQNKEVMKELFGVVAPKIGDRPGGYLRIIKTGFRRGDGADTAMIELVDFNEIYNPKGNKLTASKKKTRRGASKKTTTTVSTVSPSSESSIVTTSSTTTTTTTSKIVDIDYDDDNTTTVINPTV
jgi:large subunit ribosomal protein L17